MVLQRRSLTKKNNPGKYSSTNGLIQLNETNIDTVIRETKEELGVNIDKDKIIGDFKLGNFAQNVIDADFGQMLHAHKIEFMHPTKNELMVFIATFNALSLGNPKEPVAIKGNAIVLTPIFLAKFKLPVAR